jgi:radical SAM superfamily enzyme YgiQ (UPF0313 family)
MARDLEGERHPMPSAVLISTYELGHQPFGLASPAAWLRRDGIDVALVDLTKDRLDPAVVTGAGLVAFHLPMHTATRLAAPTIEKVREANPGARICAYGLYAPLNGEWLRSIGVTDILGGEFEEGLAAIAREACGVAVASVSAGPKIPPASQRESEGGGLPRLRFLVPDRRGLPPLERYAALRLADGSRKVVGYTEASRGCRHLCRHCPVVPIYNGQFRVVSTDVVLADIAAQVSAGAEHITFGDPDFFNGPTHAVRIVTALHDAHPALTYDATIKIEHLLRHRDLLPVLRDTGCLYVTSAVESLDDRVLALLDKGHTRQDFFDVVALCRDAGVTLQPTFVAFHPWTTIEDYCALIDALADLDLVECVAPIQLAIRLLVPRGSRLLQLDDVRRLIGAFDPMTLTYRWTHDDPRVDALQRDVAATVGRRLVSDRRVVFEEISALAHDRAGLPRVAAPQARTGAAVPYRDEPWYCCAEPNPEQVTLV